MSEELCWLCNGKVWILKLWFVLFYIYNHDVTLISYYKLNSFFYINYKYNYRGLRSLRNWYSGYSIARLSRIG